MIVIIVWLCMRACWYSIIIDSIHKFCNLAWLIPEIFQPIRFWPWIECIYIIVNYYSYNMLNWVS